MINCLVAIVVVACICSGTTGSTRYLERKAQDKLQTATNVTDIMTCPPWFIPGNDGNNCTCGNTCWNIVKCDIASQQSHLLTCYCMTYDKGIRVIGHCLSGCRLPNEQNSFYVSLPPTVPELMQMMCGHANREGQLCGRCKDGFAVPIYSYDMACVRCSEHTTNWVKYIAAAFLPLTAFLVIVVVFRISACSAQLHGFVLFSQLAAAPPQMRVVANASMYSIDGYQRIVEYYGLFSFYGIWNLDFFRLLYSPFCLYPNMTMLEALAFDYIIAVYPLALIAIMYLLIKLHDHNFRPVVLLWKPFHFCTARFRRQLDIRGSLVDAYATFFVLAYLKIVNISFDLLLPTQLFDIHGQTIDKRYLYYDATVEFFGETHCPYAILAIAVLVVFVFSPLLLLIVYPCRCFHRCTQHCGFTCNILHTFMDAFQGCYKDGTNGTRDCRYFPIVYFILRILMLLTYTITLSAFYYPLSAVMLMAAALLVAIVHPYKKAFYNAFDTYLLISSAAAYIFVLLTDIVSKTERILLVTIEAGIVMLAIIPPLYIIVYILYWILSQTRMAAIFQTILSRNETNLEDSLPHRITHVDEYTPLLLATAAENELEENRKWTENTAYGV